MRRPPDPARRDTRPPSPGQVQPAGPSVYLADPDELFRDNLAHALRQVGAYVVEFASGGQLGARALRGKPDLIVLASDREDMAGCQVLSRLKCHRTGQRYPLVLVADKNLPFERAAGAVQSFLGDWHRLCVRNLAGVLTLLQARAKSGRFEVEAFGARGTILLRKGEVVEAQWKTLRGREVLRFFAEELPNEGFRFAERLQEVETYASPDAHVLPPGAQVLPPAPRLLVPPQPAGVRTQLPLTEARLEFARALLERRRFSEAFVYLRMAQDLGGSSGELQYLLGLAHLRTGDVALAVNELLEARQALPQDARVNAALREATEALARAIPPTGPEAPAPVHRAPVSGEPVHPPRKPLSVETARAGRAGNGQPAAPGSERRELFTLALVLVSLLSLTTALAVLVDGRSPVRSEIVGLRTGSREASPPPSAPGRPERAPPGPGDPGPHIAAQREPPHTTPPHSRQPDTPPRPAAVSQPISPEEPREQAAAAQAVPIPAGAPPTLEALRGRPQSVRMDQRPRPRSLVDPRSARALLDPRSGRLDLVKRWTETVEPGLQAEVWVLVDESGSVAETRLLRTSGNAELDARSLEAVRNVRYRPARRGGRAIPAWTRQRVTFGGE